MTSIISAKRARSWYRSRADDPYGDEVYRLWAIKQRSK